MKHTNSAANRVSSLQELSIRKRQDELNDRYGHSNVDHG
jgi:hypothetical protein